MSRHAVVRTTTGRLLAVADIVEDGERWQQHHFTERATTGVLSDRTMNPAAMPDAVNRDHDCGAFGCIAGHGVAMAPMGALKFSAAHFGDAWEDAGAQTFGLDIVLAEYLFKPSLGEEAKSRRKERVAKVLRWLATFSHNDRTGDRIEGCEQILRTGRAPKGGGWKP